LAEFAVGEPPPVVADAEVALFQTTCFGFAAVNGSEAETGRLKQRYLRIRDNWRRLTNCEFRQETFLGGGAGR